MTEFLAELRSQTRDWHRTIETNPHHRSLVDGTMTRDGYRLMLERVYGFVNAFEAQAASRKEWAGFSFDFEPRRKNPAITEDLLVLGDTIQDVERLPLAPMDLERASFERVLGYLYVVEGSTLGGQILARIAFDRWGARLGAGATYFNFYGASVRERWAECQSLLTLAAASGDGAEIVDGARSAFAALDGWLRSE
jgi:heme oxygenase